MLETFPDIGAPDWGLASDPQATVTSISLGDGYDFRRPEGINHIRESWSPSWSSLDPAMAESAYQWLRERLSWRAFLWNNPATGQTMKVLCTNVRLSLSEWGNSTLTATFRQDFNPV
ncbi:Phage minor tail protein [compost metagenome]